MNVRNKNQGQTQEDATWYDYLGHHFDKDRNQQCAVGVFSEVEAADRAVDLLIGGNIAKGDISIVTDPKNDSRLEQAPIDAGDEMEERAGIGAGIGGLLGLLLSGPPLWIAGAAPVLLIGPIAAGVTGAIVGGYVAALSGWGVHSNKLDHYQRRVEEGAVLVVVSGYPLTVAVAQRILRESEADDVAMFARSSADAEDITDETSRD